MLECGSVSEEEACRYEATCCEAGGVGGVGAFWSPRIPVDHCLCSPFPLRGAHDLQMRVVVWGEG